MSINVYADNLAVCKFLKCSPEKAFLPPLFSTTGKIIVSADSAMVWEGLKNTDIGVRAENVFTNVAILMRAYSESDHTPHLGIVHVCDLTKGLKELESAIMLLKEKTSNAAIEGFVCGGMVYYNEYPHSSPSISFYNPLKSKMESLGVTICDSHFGKYPTTVGVLQAGFDSNFQPYAVYKA